MNVEIPDCMMAEKHRSAIREDNHIGVLSTYVIHGT